MFTASIVQPPIGCKAALQPIVLRIQIQATRALSQSDSQINSFVICCSHKLPDVSSREHTLKVKNNYAQASGCMTYNRNTRRQLFNNLMEDNNRFPHKLQDKIHYKYSEKKSLISCSNIMQNYFLVVY